MSDLVLLEIKDQIAVLTLNRPEVRNALSPALLESLSKQLDTVENNPRIRAVVLTGAGNTFSSGADLENLKHLLGASAEMQKQDSSLIAQTLKRIYQFPKPIIAALEGAAVAGGAGLATACDLIVAAENTKIGYTEVKLGFVAAIVSVFLIRAIGEKHARELLLTGRLISALEAHRMGLVNEVVPTGTAFARAMEIAQQIAQNSSTALSTSKELLSSLYSFGLEDGLQHAATVNAWIRGTNDLQEGVTAFLEKRSPKWKN
jgi:methylglutaconyl-CoA hydratase